MTTKRLTISIAFGLVLSFGFVGYAQHNAQLTYVAALFSDEKPTVEAPKPQRKPGEKLVVVVKLDQGVNPESGKKFISDIAKANRDGADAIVVELDTPGGEVLVGQRMAKAIEDSNAPVTCVVDTAAMSMGFYILQSCPVRTMTKRSRIMVHEPSQGAGKDWSGRSVEWRREAEELDSMNRAMCEHEGARLTIGPEGLRKRIAGRDWFMSWEDAVQFHAVDGVVESTRSVVEHLKVGEPAISVPPSR